MEIGVRQSSIAELFYAHQHEDPPAVTSGRPDLPPPVDGVIARALAKTPDQRYRTCAEFARELTAALGRQIAGGHVFISYVREDSSRVDGLQEALEAVGITVWRDTAQLWPGQDWRQKIRHAITNDALVFIACFSYHSASRRQSYMNEELTLAIDQWRLHRPGDSWLIPVRFDDCAIPDIDLGRGQTLSSIQRADLFGDYSADQIGKLTMAVRNILTAPP